MSAGRLTVAALLLCAFGVLPPAAVLAAPGDSLPAGVVMPADAAAIWCYRFGRCSFADLYYFRDRPNRLERLAPQPPASVPAPAAPAPPRTDVRPTPEENIQPAYRSASRLREEYRTSE